MTLPDTLRRAYFHSASTLNCIRSLLSSGFADLHNPRSWSLSHVRNPELAASFESIVERLEDSLDFLKVIGGESGSLSSVDLYTSHEVPASARAHHIAANWHLLGLDAGI